MSQDLNTIKNRSDLLIQSNNTTMPSLKGTNHKQSNSLSAIPQKGLDKNVMPQTEKIKGLNQAFQNLQNSTIPQKTMPVGNIIQQSFSGSENAQGKKKGNLASKNLQH